MKNNKLDIFEQNAEFFERFNNSLEDTAKDRHDRTRFTVTGLENKVEFAVNNAEGRIKKAEDDAIANIVDTTQSVGTGKYLRAGAYGVGTNRPPTITNFTTSSPSQFFEVLPASAPPAWGIKEPSGGILMPRNARPIALVFPNRPELSITYLGSAGWSDRFNFYTEYNTRTDKNNVLHSGTSTPINTLNVSDMAQEVVDRDDVTVTSGAVYRVIQELRAEITLLKGKLNE